jgi:peptide/nickel transport system substrate-binding protein
MRPFTSRPSCALAIAGTMTAVLAAAAPPCTGQDAGAPGTALTVSPGPRANDWKRAFNPFRDDTDTRWPATAGVHEPLIVYSRATRTYLPWLASAYKWGAGNLSLQFSIRPGVVWSDGAPFTARDVAFTFDLMRRFPALDRPGVWGFLGDVKVIDPATVEFTFRRAYTPGFEAVGTQPIVAEHHWKDVAQPATFDDPSPVGTGPFVEVRRFEPTVYELRRNPKYWQAGKPGVDALRVRLYRNNEEILNGLTTADLDWASLFVADIEKSWVATAPARHLYWYPDLGPTVMLYVNTQKKPFDDPESRKAISLAIDRPRIMREALNGYAVPADATGLAESQKVWKDPALVQSGAWTRRDVAQAGKQLDAAGLARKGDVVRAVSGGGPMRYDLAVVDGWSDWVTAAGIIRQNLAEVGVDVTVRPLGYDAFHEALERGRFDMGIWFAERGATPYQFYRSQLDPLLVRPIGEKVAADFHRFGSEEAGRLLRRLEASAEETEQMQVSRSLQKIFVDSAPSLPLFASPLWGVFNTSRVTGFPSRFHPYAAAVPGLQSDNLPVLVEVKPR